MTAAKFTLFDTPIGSCGIAWNETGILALQLPASTASATRARLQRIAPGAVESPPPQSLRRTISSIRDLLSGRPGDLTDATLDMSGVPPFHRRVYEAARRIPPGDTMSYGSIATAIGAPGSARAVGQALGRNPFAIIVPCHRVVAANGKLGGFSAIGGVTTKATLLHLESPTASESASREETMATTSASATKKTSPATKTTPARKTTTATTTPRKTATAPRKTASSATRPRRNTKADTGESAPKATKTAATAAKPAINARATAKTAGDGKAEGKAATSAGGAAMPVSASGGRHEGYGFDPKKALAHLRKADPKLAAFIDRAGPFEMVINPADSVFGMLAEAIVYQQLTAKAAATIFGQVCAATNSGKRPKPKDVLATSHEELRAAGLSNAKTLALLDLAAKAESGELPTLAKIKKLPDDEIIDTLIKVRGVGRWTAEMFLIFRLGRPDVLPLDDYGLRRGYTIVFGTKELPTKTELTEAGEKWAPYRTAASWYLWKAAE